MAACLPPIIQIGHKLGHLLTPPGWRFTFGELVGSQPSANGLDAQRELAANGQLRNAALVQFGGLLIALQATLAALLFSFLLNGELRDGRRRINLVERWFGELDAKAIRRGVSPSVKELKAYIDAFMTAWNKTPRPYVWTATVEAITEKLSRCRPTLEKIQPSCTGPRTRKPKRGAEKKGTEMTVQFFTGHCTSVSGSELRFCDSSLR